jgi:hypothetical protein
VLFVAEILTECSSLVEDALVNFMGFLVSVCLWFQIYFDDPILQPDSSCLDVEKKRGCLVWVLIHDYS